MRKRALSSCVWQIFLLGFCNSLNLLLSTFHKVFSKVKRSVSFSYLKLKIGHGLNEGQIVFLKLFIRIVIRIFYELGTILSVTVGGNSGKKHKRLKCFPS